MFFWSRTSHPHKCEPVNSNSRDGPAEAEGVLGDALIQLARIALSHDPLEYALGGLTLVFGDRPMLGTYIEE